MIADNNLKLWYNAPALEWNEALPIGNGRIGAMIEGGVEEDKIYLNEDSLWAGYAETKDKEEAYRYLEQVRNYIYKGEYKQAQDVIEDKMLCSYNQPYQPLGILHLFSDVKGKVKKYKRELDLSTGIEAVYYTIGGATYKKEYFISYPDDVFVIKITGERKEDINLSILLECALRSDITIENRDICLKGRCPERYANYVVEEELYGQDPDYGISGHERGMVFAGRVRIYPEGGTYSNDGYKIQVKQADSVTIFVTAATGYREKNPMKKCVEILNKASGKEYKLIYNNHIKDYKKLFESIYISIENQGKQIELPTDERLRRLKSNSSDNGLVALMFQYGRYLMISSSRPGTLPSNLQGIWNADIKPAWWSNWTVNINTEMNYWPAESCGLSECQEPLYDFIESLVEPGKITARKHYRCRGFVSHHQLDIWRQTCPVGRGERIYEGSACYAFWPMSSGWLCQHLWEHYLFSLDREFLIKRAYPVMREAALFYLDWLVEDSEGNLITCPSTSPENVFYIDEKEIAAVTYGSTMDMQIIYDLFSNVISAAKVLDTDQEFCSELEEKRNRLIPLRIGKFGQIQEYPVDFDEVEIGHRHISHLFGLYPGKMISPEKTPELAQAAIRTLQRRLAYGSGHTGWSCAWIINMWARLYDGKMAGKYIEKMLQESVYLNLLDSCPPFQIDGNFGFTAGVAEMLLQSHQDFVYILPALPKSWRKGEIRGLRARGGHRVDIKWEDAQFCSGVFTAGKSGNCKIKCQCDIRIKQKSKEQIARAGEKISIKVKQGEKVLLYKLLS